MWKLSGKLAVEYFSGFTATERLDHGTIINNLFTIVKRKNNKDLYKGLRFLLSVGQMQSSLYPHLCRPEHSSLAEAWILPEEKSIGHDGADQRGYGKGDKVFFRF